MKHMRRQEKELQFWLAKEFIEERLCLSVPTKAIADFAAFIEFFEQQSYLAQAGSYGGRNDNHKS